jgi:hypothetical protein
MVKHEPRDVARTNNEKDTRSADRPRCVELSAFELELIAGGTSTAYDGYSNTVISAKR